MRLALILVLLSLQTSLFAQFPADVQHYRYAIVLNDENDTIYGKAEITVKYTRAVNAINFDLVNIKSSGRGMNALGVTGTNVLGMVRQNDQLKIQLTKMVAPGDTATYTILYKGIPDDGLIISKNKYGHRSFFADNWPDRGHNWLPCHDDPADKASVEFIVRAPQHYQVVANGVQVEETNLPDQTRRTHWREDVPVSTKVMVIGVAEFAVNLSGYVNGCIPVYSWVYPEDREKGFYDYALANMIMPFYISHIGTYGYKKLANVQSKTIFGGLENANTIFYAESSVSGTRKNETLLAHEIAHQWFGNMATEKTFGHLWLSEGFATYMTVLYMENRYGHDTAVAMLKDDREKVIAFSRSNSSPVVDTVERDYMKLLTPNNYEKGGWILHMLKSQLGDSIFWKSIRRYYELYAGTTAGTEDLQHVFESVSGKKLDGFFRQWLYQPGIPDLDIAWKYNSAIKKIELTVSQRQANIFSFPLDIGLPNDKSIQQLSISKKTETFQIPVKISPTQIIVDPFTRLLFNASVKKQ